MKDILIISHFSDGYNENNNDRFNYLAARCATEHQTELLTSSFSHVRKAERERRSEEPLPYKLTYAHEPPYYSNLGPRRFYSHFSFGRSVAAYLKRRTVPDAILCAVPSLEAAHFAASYCREKGIRFVVDIQDLWPEAFKMVLKAPYLTDLLLSPFTWMARRIYQSASCLVSVSHTFLDVALRYCVKAPPSQVVYLGTDLAAFDDYCRRSSVAKPADEVWVTYVGTLGASYDINLVSDAIALLRGRGRKELVFKVIGDGPRRDEFERYARSLDVACDFKGRLSYPEMVGMLQASDIAVNPIVAGSQGSIINKHGDYAAAGLPVVNTQESAEYRRLLVEHECGLNCASGDAVEVAAAIERLAGDQPLAGSMGRNSRRLAELKFDRARTYPDILDAVCQ